jgi:hypothetical protein
MGKTNEDIEIPDGLTADELLRFRYLQAVYSLNTFYGHRIRTSGCFETKDESLCAEVINRGGDIVEMYKAGADALYCALLLDSLTEEDLFQKTLDRFIPFW